MKYLIHVTLLFFTALSYASETFIVGQMYDLPVDCGHDASFKPDYTKLLDKSSKEELYSERWFYDENGTTVKTWLDYSLYDNRYPNEYSFQGGSLGYSLRWSFQEYIGGCVYNKFMSMTTHPIFPSNPISGMILTKRFSVPQQSYPEQELGFYLNIEILKRDIPRFDENESRVIMSLLCHSNMDSALVKDLEDLQPGTHMLTVQMEEFSLSQCSEGDTLELKITFLGHNLQLNGVQSMFYELF